MATHLRNCILWLTLALYVVSICQGDIRDIVTEDFFNKILYGRVVTGALSADVGDIATQYFFSGILSNAFDDFPGKKFYTYSDFINATTMWPGFGTTGTFEDCKREIAAFFATVAYFSNNLCYVEAINKSCGHCEWKDFCVTLPIYSQYPCTAGKQYYARGPVQLAWNDNYANVGRYLGFDGLKDPDIVARDGLISWKTALWFWMKRTDCHSDIISGQGFGATIRDSFGQGCNGQNLVALNNRIRFYTDYCSQLGVDVGSDISC